MLSTMIVMVFCIYAVMGFRFIPTKVGATSQANVNVQGESSALKMAVELAPLPYDYTALEPHIGEQTLRIHHDKHHAKYVSTTNAMITGTELEKADVVTILKKSYGTNQGLFNNAAQSYNHAFYWDSMKPNGGGLPTGKIADLINKQFGDYAKFRAEFTQAALTQFGSGWAWLVWTPSGLKITKSGNADCPLTEKDQVPLLTIDVWEHAYYLNYQNMRNTYVDTFLDKLVNWDFANKNLPATA
jgi:superoxide dismutase, Fe-Mn family